MPDPLPTTASPTALFRLLAAQPGFRRGRVLLALHRPLCRLVDRDAGARRALRRPGPQDGWPIPAAATAPAARRSRCASALAARFAAVGSDRGLGRDRHRRLPGRRRLGEPRRLTPGAAQVGSPTRRRSPPRLLRARARPAPRAAARRHAPRPRRDPPRAPPQRFVETALRASPTFGPGGPDDPRPRPLPRRQRGARRRGRRRAPRGHRHPSRSRRSIPATGCCASKATASSSSRHATRPDCARSPDRLLQAVSQPLGARRPHRRDAGEHRHRRGRPPTTSRPRCC